MNYLVSDTELTSIANAIRTKGETTDPLVFPAGFVSAVEDISTGGGGDAPLYIFTDSGYISADAAVSNTTLTLATAFYGSTLVAGATVTFSTYGSYILDTVTGQTSGSTIPFTTVQRGTYTFTMPNESVYCSLYYDD